MATKPTKRQPFNVRGDLRNNGQTLLLQIDLDGSIKPLATKKAGTRLFGTTHSPVRILHPTIPGLFYSVKVGQRLSNEPPELQALREQQRAIKAKIKAFRAARKEAKK